MSISIWYVSKYVALPGSGTAGGRGYLLMRELARMGHYIAIITSDSNQLAQPPLLKRGYLLQELDGISLYWLRTTKYSVAKSFRRVLSWLHFEWRLVFFPHHKLQRPDVVVVSSLSLLTILNGLWWRFRYGCRLIFEIRDIWPLTLVEEGGFSSSNPFVSILALIERFGYRYSDEIVGTMPNLGMHVQKVLGYTKATHCIPMGIDLESLISPMDLPDDFVKMHIPPGKFVVAYVGTIGITNALEVFLKCAETMEEDSPDVHFLLVGDGPLRETFRRQYSHLTNLAFAPRVPKGMVQSVLANCDLLYFSVYPSSVWDYGQSLNKLIDYMISGKPVLASYSGYQSMINEANCGTFVPADDVSALTLAVAHYACMNYHDRILIGARGREWLLANRSYTKLARDYLDVMLTARYEPESVL